MLFIIHSFHCLCWWSKIKKSENNSKIIRLRLGWNFYWTKENHKINIQILTEKTFLQRSSLMSDISDEKWPRCDAPDSKATVRRERPIWTIAFVLCLFWKIVNHLKLVSKKIKCLDKIKRGFTSILLIIKQSLLLSDCRSRTGLFPVLCLEIYLNLKLKETGKFYFCCKKRI